MRVALMLLILTAAALQPLAQADHVFSHRYVFEGRLVGADGLPLPGREVAFFAEGPDELSVPCPGDHQQPVTNEFGDFRFCWHAHGLDTDTTVGVRYGNITGCAPHGTESTGECRKPIDTSFRRTIVLLYEPNETGAAPLEWNATYRIAGRTMAWGAADELEDVRVFGLTRPNIPINVTVTTPANAEPTTFQAHADEFGDFVIEVVTEAAPDDVTVSLEAAGRTIRAPLDPFHHRTTLPLFLPSADAQAVDTESPRTEVTTVPGSTTPAINPVFLVALAIAVVAAIYMSKRR